MMDDRLDDLLREAARDYNEPPEPPREEMWAAIQAERAERKEAEAGETGFPVFPIRRFRHFRRLTVRPLTWGAGIAALLVLGVGLGRLSVERPGTAPTPAPAPVATAAPPVRSTAYHLATTEHLSQSETFLTLFKASVRGQGDERLASATARQLLATNRLLLDSPAASDTRTRLLLQDVELVLAEIAQLSPQPRSRDLQLITEGMEQGGVLSRLRTAVPAGTSATQGAL